MRAKEPMRVGRPKDKKRATDNGYSTGQRDSQIVAPTVLLLKKMEAAAARPEEKLALREARNTFERWPKAGKCAPVSIELIGPRRWLGEREIFHWWDVHIADDSLHVSSGGHLYEHGRGCDTFFSFMWHAAWGVPSEYASEKRPEVTDAMPFEQEVCLMDFKEPGYTILVSRDVPMRLEAECVCASKPELNATVKDGEAATECELCGRALEPQPKDRVSAFTTRDIDSRLRRRGRGGRQRQSRMALTGEAARSAKSAG
jgi:hypothetical protein